MSRRRLALFDLDDTLVSRASAFRSWARRFVENVGSSDATEVDWLESADGDGYVAREDMFERVRARYQLKQGVPELLATYRDEFPNHFEPISEETALALTSLRHAGWRIAIVTNGSAIQEDKIRHARLVDFVDTWVISEVCGFRKPDPRIFRLAAAQCGEELRADAWVVGDGVDSDIAGAHALGISSVWISRGREWTEPGHRPTHVARDASEAIRQLMS